MPATSDFDAVVGVKGEVMKEEDTVDAVAVWAYVSDYALIFGLFDVRETRKCVVANAGGH